MLLALVLSVAGCSKPAAHNDPIPEHQTFRLESKRVNETRVICVWTPPGYEESSDRFPVLYMPDGGIKEDFPHIANTIADLVSQGLIEPLIVVGIENTDRRRDLTGPTEVESEAKLAPPEDTSSQFRAFIRDELIPEIDRRYRTHGSRAIVGESLAGLFVVETFLLTPELFDIYIAMDPSIYWNNRYLVTNAPRLLGAFPDEPKKFWFAGSGAGDILKNTRALSEILPEHAPASVTWKYADEPDEKHSTIFRNTKERAFLWSLWKNEEATRSLF